MKKLIFLFLILGMVLVVGCTSSSYDDCSYKRECTACLDDEKYKAWRIEWIPPDFCNCHNLYYELENGSYVEYDDLGGGNETYVKYCGRTYYGN